MQQSEPLVGVLLISTGKYKQFVPSLIQDISERVLFGEKKIVFLFTDEHIWGLGYDDEDVMVCQFIIPSYKFPQATLYRYKIFSEHVEQFVKCTHLIYLDADMAIKQRIGHEILSEGLLAVRHPGFFKNNGWGSPNTDSRSTAYLPQPLRYEYFCGGVQGGSKHSYLAACAIMTLNISTDEFHGITAEWNDETHWNWYLKTYKYLDTVKLDPSYCMVEQKHLREKWGVADLPAKIIALEKNHKEIRE
jgi:hypothetical protein